MTEKSYRKDPSAVLDYSWDWNKNGWLQAGESIVDHTVTVESGITKDSDSESGGVVTAWLSGGTAGESYVVACLIETDNVPKRVEERSILIVCMER